MARFDAVDAGFSRHDVVLFVRGINNDYSDATAA
jgi:hypothetical protein